MNFGRNWLFTDDKKLFHGLFSALTNSQLTAEGARFPKANLFASTSPSPRRLQRGRRCRPSGVLQEKTSELLV